jgi:hypothetical protein
MHHCGHTTYGGRFTLVTVHNCLRLEVPGQTLAQAACRARTQLFGSRRCAGHGLSVQLCQRGLVTGYEHMGMGGHGQVDLYQHAACTV